MWASLAAIWEAKLFSMNDERADDLMKSQIT